jgi:cell division initiation protein
VKVTPLDIRRKEFRRSVRGYLDEDVDVFLDTVADEVERISKVNDELIQKVRELQEQVSGHTHIREALEKTLVAAQLQSDEIRSKAQKESQSMLREAEAKAKAVVDDFYAQTRAVQQTLMQLKLLEEDFRFKFKGLLDGYMKLLDGGPLVLSTPETAAQAFEPAEMRAVEIGAGEAAEERRASEVDESPTFETAEAAGLVAGEGVAAPTKRRAPAPSPPHLPKIAQAPKATAGDVDDLTVETDKIDTKGRGGKQAKGPAEAEKEAEEKEGGVYFGRIENDPDDPFPEIGGDSSRPRDFEW